MAKQKVKGHSRYIEGGWKTVKPYTRKERKRSGKGKLYPKLIRVKPRRAIRDRFTGEIIGFK